VKWFLKIVGGLFLLAALLLAWPAYQLAGELSKMRSEDPLVWEDDIRALEEATAGRFSPGEAVVFVGSSSIRLWSTLEEDMAPIPVIQHGFGGAKLNDVVHYAGRLVNTRGPRAVVVFAGTNDIHPGAVKEPEVLLASYQLFVQTVREDGRDVPIYFIGITPSPLRWEVWDVAAATNELIREWSATQAGLHYIETGPALLGPDGRPDKAYYIFDGLHLSEQGYATWTSIIRPRLLEDLDIDPASP